MVLGAKRPGRRCLGAGNAFKTHLFRQGRVDTGRSIGGGDCEGLNSLVLFERRRRGSSSLTSGWPGGGGGGGGRAGSGSSGCSFSTLSSTISCCSICCIHGGPFEDAHESGHILITSKADFTITCWRIILSVNHDYSQDGAGARGGPLTDYQGRRVGSEVDIKRQSGDGAGQEQDAVGDHVDELCKTSGAM